MPPLSVMSREDSLALGQRVLGYMSAPDDARVGISSGYYSETEFALNQVQDGADGGGPGISFDERFGQKFGWGETDEVPLGETALRAVVARTEALARALDGRGATFPARDPLRPPAEANAALWSDATVGEMPPERRLAPILSSMNALERAGLTGAGRIFAGTYQDAALTKDGHFEYGRYTRYQYSLTARTKDGTGSGWAGWTGEDVSKADPQALTERASDLALRTRNPVAVEPGRYTVVMTAEAVGALVSSLASMFDGSRADSGLSPFSRPGGGNKLGLKVFDEQVTLSIDPMDPEGGFLPFQYVAPAGRILQYRPVTWVERGNLKTLSYPTQAQAAAHGLESVVGPVNALRMAGGSTTIDEMIASTTRGIYVTRFSSIMLISQRTLFQTGVTRDGTFLIEHGKITKPIKNMRFEDSPMFAFNNLIALGPARRVYVGDGSPVIVAPCATVRDFAFTSLTDAV
jgi:predicted Zn-dependent protease